MVATRNGGELLAIDQRLYDLAVNVLEQARSIVGFVAFTSRRGPAPNDWEEHANRHLVLQSQTRRTQWLADRFFDLKRWRWIGNLEMHRLQALAEKAGRRKDVIEHGVATVWLKGLSSGFRASRDELATRFDDQKLRITGPRRQIGTFKRSSFFGVLLDVADTVLAALEIDQRTDDIGPLLDALEDFDWEELQDGVDAEGGALVRSAIQEGVSAGGQVPEPETILVEFLKKMRESKSPRNEEDRGDDDPGTPLCCVVERTSSKTATVSEGSTSVTVNGPRRVELLLMVAHAQRRLTWQELVEADVRNAGEVLDRRIKSRAASGAKLPNNARGVIPRGEPTPQMATQAQTLQNTGSRIRKDLGKLAYHWDQDGQGVVWNADCQ